MDDYYLTRFLRARQYDLEKTMLMWTTMIKWRAEENVDQIVQTYDFPYLEALQKIYEHGYHKTCKEGRSVYIDRIGGTDMDTINTVITDKQMIYHNVFSYEELILKKMHVLSIERGSKME
jgi:hypothetical protein